VRLELGFAVPSRCLQGLVHMEAFLTLLGVSYQAIMQWPLPSFTGATQFFKGSHLVYLHV